MAKVMARPTALGGGRDASVHFQPGAPEFAIKRTQARSLDAVVVRQKHTHRSASGGCRVMEKFRLPAPVGRDSAKPMVAPAEN
jgi:hypothetical protein